MNSNHELSDGPTKNDRGWIRSLHQPSSLRFLAWCLFIGTTLGMFFAVLQILSEFHTFNTLKSTGNHANATVSINRTVEGGETTAYYITYEFTAVDGQRYAREQNVSGATYKAMGVGATLEIVYDRNNPTISRLDNFDAPSVSELIYGSIVWVPFSLFIILSFIRSRLGNRQSA